MIISDRHRFAFIHIPKCAGSYVRHYLEPFDDSGGAHATRVDEHAWLGRVDFVHIPMAVLRQYFAEEYRKIRRYRTFALVRDPVDRFASSVSQRLRMYGGRRAEDFTRWELTREVDAVIEYLATNAGRELLPPGYIHFQPQTDYIYDGGDRIVQSVYTMDNVAALLDDIGKLVGMTFDLEKVPSDHVSKRSRAYRNEIVRVVVEAVQFLSWRLAARLVPERGRQALRRLVYVPRSRRFPDVFESSVVTAFVEDYYRKDLAFYRSVVAEQDPGRPRA